MNEQIFRKPRNHGVGGKLTVFKRNDLWEVRYVSSVDRNGIAWCTALPPHTTETWKRPPFSTWDEAMAHAATLRTYYGDQCRGDNLLWNRRHGRRGEP